MTPPASPTTSATPPAAEDRTVPPNPFVGPRALREGEPLFGRSRELGAIRDLLIAERILVLFSPSGAGKTSLLEAGLRPELARRDFNVPPTIRVSHELPPDVEPEVRNRYVLSTLLSLERAERAEPGEPAVVDRDLPDGLARFDRSDLDERDPCFIFDQFEELFTLDPTDLEAKAEFMTQLGASLRDRGRWAIFAIRLDLLGELDRYAHLVPTRFCSTYRLDLLTKGPAKTAIVQTAGRAGVTVTDSMAERIVDDLSTIRVHEGRIGVPVPGPYVEPLLLQVVCRHRWPQLVAGETEPAVADPSGPSDVDTVLSSYYDELVIDIATRTGASEADIRSWVEDSLISRDGLRTQTLAGPVGHSSADVVGSLIDGHLIRVDPRAGANWYELTHDRLVEPVRKSNRAWRATHHPLRDNAGFWVEHGRPPRLLLSGPELRDAEEWTSAHPEQVRDVEREFVVASMARRDRRRTMRTLAALLTVVSLALLLAFAYLLREARIARDDADTRAESASRTYEAINDTDPLSQPLRWAQAYELLDGLDADPFLERQVVSAAHHLRHDPAYIAVAGDLSADGRVLARGTPDGRVELIVLQSGRRTPVVTGVGQVLDVEFAPDGGRLAIAAERQGGEFVVGMWDAAAGGEVDWFETRPAGEVTGLTFAGELVGGVVRRGSAEPSVVQWWDAATGRDGGEPVISAGRLLASGDGRVLVVASDDGISVGSPGIQMTALTSLERDAIPLAVNRDGSQILVTVDGQRVLRIVSIATAVVEPLELPATGTLSGSPPIVAATFTGDGGVVALDGIGGLAIWQEGGDVWHLSPSRPQLPPRSIRDDVLVDFSGSGGHVAVVDPGGRKVGVWDRLSDHPRMVLGDTVAAPAPKGAFDSSGIELNGRRYVMWGTPATSATDPGERYLAVGNSEGGVVVWDLTTGEESTRFVFDTAIDRLVLGNDRAAVVLGEGIFGGTDLRIFEKDDFVQSDDRVPVPVGGLQLFVGGFMSVEFGGGEQSVLLEENDGYDSELDVRPDVASAAAEVRALTVERGLDWLE